MSTGRDAAAEPPLSPLFLLLPPLPLPLQSGGDALALGTDSDPARRFSAAAAARLRSPPPLLPPVMLCPFALSVVTTTALVRGWMS
jgi:hypothetical protein